MLSSDWKPEYSRWRHGGWYVHNVRYPSGACGCVSSNYADKKWRIVDDRRAGEHTYKTRDAAAFAELQIAEAEHKAMAPWLAGLDDPQLRYSAVSLFGDIDRYPEKGLDEMIEGVLRLRQVDAAALRRAGERYHQRPR